MEPASHTTSTPDEALRAENADLRRQLGEAEEMLRAIRAGELDAFVVESTAGPQLFTLQGLDAEQNRLRGEMLAQVSDAVIATDPEDRITYLNPAAERRYRVRPSDVLGRKLTDVYTPQWPSPDVEAAAFAALDERGHWCGEKVHRTHDGRLLPVEASIAILRDPDTGARTGLIASIRDITERELAKQVLHARTAELETLLDTLPGFVWIARDAECHVIVGNRTANEFIGVETNANISQSAVTTGEAPYLCQLKEDGTEYRVDELPLQRAIATGLPVRDAVLNFHFRDGRKAYVVGDAVPLFDENGLIRGGLAVFVDITERKKADEQLLISEARLRRVFESNVVGMIRWDLERSLILDANAEFLEMTGYVREDITSGRLNFRDLTPPEWTARNEEGIRAIRTNGHAAPYEKEYFRKDGSRLPLIIAGTRFEDSPSEGMSFLIDLTEMKQAEAALRERTELLNGVLEGTTDIIFVKDMDGRLLLANAAFAAAARCNPEQLVGKMDEDWFPPGVAAAVRQQDEAVIAAGSPMQFEDTVPVAGEARSFLTLKAPLRDGSNRVLGILGIGRDITERKQAEGALRASEERMRLATEATEVGIWEWNVLSGTLRWDAQMFRLYGVVPTADGFVSYETWSRAVRPEDLARQEELLADTVRRCGKSSREFHILRADNGECRCIQSVETVRTNEEGKAEWVLGTNLDVTEQRNYERAIREASEKAVAANAAKDRFLAVLSHELRTPLTPVLMTVAALEHDPDLRRDLKEDMAMIRQNIELETKLIDDLLDVSRIASGKLELRTERLELNAAVLHVCSMCRPQVYEQGVELTLDLSEDAGLIQADAARLEQVIWNVLKNAVKFTPRNGKIHVASKRLSDERVEVRVTDSGAGIPAQVLPRIFDAFEQGDPHITRQFGGLGLGLAISKALIELHGGTIRAESRGEGQGSTFVIELPGTRTEAPVREPSRDLLAEEGGPRPAVRLLVVEDHRDTARALKTLLSLEGFVVTTADTVASALALAKVGTFDVLVSDLGLPDASGHELMRRMQDVQPLPGIAMSGYGMEADVRKSHEAGFSEHLVKPMKIPQLIAAIQRLLTARGDGRKS